jgi:DNA processing protein
MKEEELKQQLALHLLPGIGPILARALLSYCGSIENIFNMKVKQLERIPGIGSERAKLIQKKNLFEKAEEEIRFIRKNNIRPLFYLDDDFPKRLKNCEDAPLMIFCKGNADLNAERMIAIVGTRFITSYGKEMTDKLVNDLAKYKTSVVSGLAYGVDIQAHRSALNAALPTLGVLAHGLDRLYPSENKSIADKMIETGCIISEYTSRTKPDRENFVARNRIVAGMCDAVIVIESAVKGGALITAELANDYNREVFALPGRVGDHYSAGCHQLIRNNKAVLFENAEQVAEMMNWQSNSTVTNKKNQLELFVTLNKEEKKIVEILHEKGRMEIDVLATLMETPVNRVSATLLTLEFAGVLRTLPGKVYELVRYPV